MMLEHVKVIIIATVFVFVIATCHDACQSNLFFVFVIETYYHIVIKPLNYS